MTGIFTLGRHGKGKIRPPRWADVAPRIVDYAGWHQDFESVLGNPCSLVVAGPPGLGKSTYILWAIASSLNKSINSWFTRAIFLDRTRFNDWPTGDQLRKDGFEPRDTVLILDSPFEIDDDHDGRERKARHIGHAFQDFNVITTMRDDEYGAHASNLTNFIKATLPWESVQFWQILQSRIVAWGGHPLPEVAIQALENKLREVSDNAPLYLELLVNQLAQEQKLNALTPIALEKSLTDDLPQGVINLVWQIITKICGAQSTQADPILFLIKLLQKSNVSLSNHFLMETIRISCGNDKKLLTAMQAQLNRVTYYLDLAEQRLPTDLEDTSFLRLKGQWREPLAHFGMQSENLITSPYQGIIRRYLEVDHQGYLPLVCEQIQARLGEHIYSDPQAALCSDVIRLNAPNAQTISRLYLGSRGLYRGSVPISRIDNLLFDAWLSRAFALPNALEALQYFDAAFEFSSHLSVGWRKENEKRPLNAYISLRRVKILPVVEGIRFAEEVAAIKQFSERLIALDLNDARSRRGLAQLYMLLGSYDMAVSCFKSAIAITKNGDLEWAYILIDWAVCLRRRAKDLKLITSELNVHHLLLAQQLLDRIFHFIETSPGPQSGESSSVLSSNTDLMQRLYVVCASILNDRHMSNEAEKMLRQAMEIEPIDRHVIHSLAPLLINSGRAQEAMDLLEPLANSAGRRTDNFSLQLLAQCYSAQGIDYYHRAEFILSEARQLVQYEDNSYGDYRSLFSANLALAKLYLAWEQQSGVAKPHDLSVKAQKALRVCLQLPRNGIWHRLLCTLQPTSANYIRVFGTLESVHQSQSESSLDNHWQRMQDAYYRSDWNNVRLAFIDLVESLAIAPSNWRGLVTPEFVCEMLRIAGDAFGENREMCPHLYAGRYHASLCYLLFGCFPNRVNIYPTTTAMKGYKRERELLAAYSGDEGAKRLSRALLALHNKGSRFKRKKGAPIRAAIIFYLDGDHIQSKAHAFELAESFLDGNAQYDTHNLRLLADLLMALKEGQRALDLWKLIADNVMFPESLFANTMVAAITDDALEHNLQAH